MSRRAYVDTSLGQIHYREAGSGTPLILIHQSWASSAMWEAAIRALADRGFRAIALDLPGHGNSDPFRPAPTAADYGNAVWTFADALSLPPCPVLGHHSGATIAIWLAVNRPDRVTALALWGVPVMTPEMTEKLASEQPHDWAHAENWIGTSWANRARYSPGWTPAISMRFFRDLIAAGPNNHEYHNAIARAPIRDLLPQVAAPLLSMASDNDVLQDGSIEAARLAPDGRYVDIAGAGGDVIDSHTDAFASAIDHFLRESVAQAAR